VAAFAVGGETATDGRIVVIDHTPPAAITDLAATSPEAGAIVLSWTASGDDGSSGIAQAYDLRYSTAPITDLSFGSASALGLPAPAPAGMGQTATFFLPAGTYYLALKSRDDALPRTYSFTRHTPIALSLYDMKYAY
jgi:hypothetical protein